MESKCPVSSNFQDPFLFLGLYLNVFVQKGQIFLRDACLFYRIIC